MLRATPPRKIFRFAPDFSTLPQGEGMKADTFWADLALRRRTARVTLKGSDAVEVGHPAQALCCLDLRIGRGRIVRTIQRGELDIDLPREHFVVPIEQAGAAVGAEIPPAICRRGIGAGLSINRDRVERHKHPCHNRCAGMPLAIPAMAEGAAKRRALDDISDLPAMASSLEVLRRHALQLP